MSSTFKVEVLSKDYAAEAAARIAKDLPGGGALVLTGGTTAETIYPQLQGLKDDWSAVRIAFSDERCVPPDHAASNYGMAKRLLLDGAEPGEVVRMRGELAPPMGAATYHDAVHPLVEAGFDLLLLGMGADAHIGAMFPGSPALKSQRLCESVDRPDGMKGLTLTPPAMLSARKILLLVTGDKKAPTVARALQSDEPPASCPVRLLAEHPDVTFLLDEAAASAL
jgi:6-phosphogluconolactonase